MDTASPDIVMISVYDRSSHVRTCLVSYTLGKMLRDIEDFIRDIEQGPGSRLNKDLSVYRLRFRHHLYTYTLLQSYQEIQELLLSLGHTDVNGLYDHQLNMPAGVWESSTEELFVILITILYPLDLPLLHELHSSCHDSIE